MAGYRPEHKRSPEVIPAWNASGCWWRPALPATPLKLTVEKKKGPRGFAFKMHLGGLNGFSEQPFAQGVRGRSRAR